MLQPTSLLIVKLGSIGDVVHSLPVLTALRRRFPEARIGWVVGEAAHSLLVGHPDLSELIVLESPKRARTLWAAAQDLRARRYELSLDLQGRVHSSLLPFLARIPRRMGYRSWQDGGFLFSNLRVVEDRHEGHAVDGYLGFAAALGAPTRPVVFRVPERPEEAAAIAELLFAAGVAPAEPLVALAPGARWPSKRWPAEHFAQLGRDLAGGARVTVVGGSSDRPAAERIAGAIPGAVDLTGRATLAQAAALFRRCRAFVGSDSGPLHLAAAVGCRVVGLYGPTDPSRTGPYGEGQVALVTPAACRGCRRRECHRSCLAEIPPAAVAEAVKAILAGNPAPGRKNEG
jgi:lipopolysaccharide heptosyltransferase II